jgi:TetR/AcrR family transcriptional regulator, ethionamide resistance regulator
VPQSVTTRGRVARSEARARIVEAAVELIRERSYAELTVGEVMDRAGLERTIFYRHFENVGTLLLSAGRSAIEEMYDAQAAIVASQNAFEPEPIREALTIAAEVFHRHGPLLRGVFEAVASKQLVAVDEDEIRRRFDGLVADALRGLEARTDKRFADVDETARALNLLNEKYLLDAFGREPRVTVEVAAATLSQIWISLTDS